MKGVGGSLLFVCRPLNSDSAVPACWEGPGNGYRVSVYSPWSAPTWAVEAQKIISEAAE